jgi:hypothetical protein
MHQAGAQSPGTQLHGTKNFFMVPKIEHFGCNEYMANKKLLLINALWDKILDR